MTKPMPLLESGATPVLTPLAAALRDHLAAHLAQPLTAQRCRDLELLVKGGTRLLTTVERIARADQVPSADEYLRGRARRRREDDDGDDYSDDDAAVSAATYAIPNPSSYGTGLAGDGETFAARLLREIVPMLREFLPKPLPKIPARDDIAQLTLALVAARKAKQPDLVKLLDARLKAVLAMATLPLSPPAEAPQTVPDRTTRVSL